MACSRGKVQLVGPVIAGLVLGTRTFAESVPRPPLAVPAGHEDAGAAPEAIDFEALRHNSRFLRLPLAPRACGRTGPVRVSQPSASGEALRKKTKRKALIHWKHQSLGGKSVPIYIPHGLWARAELWLHRERIPTAPEVTGHNSGC